MQQMNAIAPGGIASMMRGMPQGQPQKPLSPTAGIGNVADRMKAYGPQGLEQKNAVSEDLLNLIAAQKLKSEKEAVLRDMQMKAAQQGQPLTVAESLDKELMQMTKQELAPQQMATQVAGASQQQAQQQQAAMQKLMQGIAKAPGAQQMPGMAGGGIVAFQNRGEVPAPESQETRDRKAILAALEKAGMGAAKLAAAGIDVVSMPVRALAGIYNTLARGPRAFGVDLPFANIGQDSLTPVMDIIRQREGIQSAYEDTASRAQDILPQAAPQLPAQEAATSELPMRMPPDQVTSKVPVAPGAGITQALDKPVMAPGAAGQGISPSPLEKTVEARATDLMNMRPETEIEAARKRRSQTMDPALQAQRAEQDRTLREREAMYRQDPERQRTQVIAEMLRGYAQPVPGGGIGQFFMNAGAAGNRYQQAQQEQARKNAFDLQRLRAEKAGIDVKSAEELFKAGEEKYKPALEAGAAGVRAGTDLITQRRIAETAAANRENNLAIARIQQAAQNRPGETERMIAEYQRLKKTDPNAAAEYLNVIETFKGAGKGVAERQRLSELKVLQKSYEDQAGNLMLPEQTRKEAAALLKQVNQEIAAMSGIGKAAAKVMTKADVEATAKSSGKSVDEVIRAARAAGYTIQ